MLLITPAHYVLYVSKYLIKVIKHRLNKRMTENEQTRETKKAESYSSKTGRPQGTVNSAK